MNLFCSSRLIVIALFVFILVGCGGGGGEGGGDEPLVTPEYDLTGYWGIVEPVSCTTVSADLFENKLAEFNSLLESALLDGLGSRVIQMGNDLESINLESGLRVDGTISGNQIRSTYSEERMLGGFEIDVYGETEGTVLNADRIALTEEVNLTVELEGEMVTIGVLCSYHAVRTG